MTKKKVKVEIITCPICGIKYKHKTNRKRHEKSKYHKVVKFYKKAMNDLIQKYQLQNSDIKV